MSDDLTPVIILHPVFHAASEGLRDDQACLEEATGLAEAIGLVSVHSELTRVGKVRPATLFGQGKVDEISAIRMAHDPQPELIIVDGALTPVQHRNLELAWNAKVLDRTALILEIFGERAQTKEGRLQVELAHLTYQRSRLVRSWTHLERQRGGAGFLGGPGERQIESDRRQLADVIDRRKKQLEDVRRTRNLQRRKRQRAPHPVVALVGYTNAGKSTLFNRLTDATVMAEDQLFATLDPTMRAVDLPGATRVIFSDTVGFISNLPTQLVAAFRATLEEVLEADIILHVRDAAHQDTDAQKQDVLSVLKELGLDEDDERPVIEVWNKTDLMDPEDVYTAEALARARQDQAEGTLTDPWIVPVSALTGQGTGLLYSEIDRVLTRAHETFRILIPHEKGAALAWLHANGEVLETEALDDGQVLEVRLSAKSAGQAEKMFGLDFGRPQTEEDFGLLQA